jgi:hypothetical protein
MIVPLFVLSIQSHFGGAHRAAFFRMPAGGLPGNAFLYAAV